MTAPDYSLSWILPFVRESLRSRGEFNFDNFVDELWPILARAGVTGIERHPPTRGYTGTTYDFSQAPYQLRVLATEAFYWLIYNGFVIPGAPTNTQGFPQQGRFYLTVRGTAWASGTEPLPEDFDGYMKLLRKLVPNLDSVIEQYVSEGLRSFLSGTYFAAAVMIGAASEKVIYMLAEAMVGSLTDVSLQKKLKELLEGRSLKLLFNFVDKQIAEAHKKKVIPYSVAESAGPHITSLIESIRVQRNDAVHPQNARVTADSVRLSYQAFPHALEKLEALRAWFLRNPKSI